MKIGNYDVPELRLVPNAVSDIKKIYDVIKSGQIETKEVGTVFGYKDYSTGIFYRRLNALLNYGLLEQLGRSTYRVTDLGRSLSYPEPEKEAIVKNKAVLNVRLWDELFKKFSKNAPIDTFWIQLKNISGIEPAEAQKIQSQIRKWYMEDISLVTLDPLGHPILGELAIAQEATAVLDQSQSLSSKKSNNKPMAQELMTTSPDQEKLEFGRAVLLLPKKDLKKEWDKLQKYMEIYLEDYQESATKAEEQSQELQNETSTS